MRLKHLAALALTVSVALLAPSAASARAYMIKGTFTQPAGAGLNNGWYWMTSPTASAGWTFDLNAGGGRPAVSAAKPGSVYLNFVMLSTSGTNGGTGFDGPIKVTVLATRPIPTRPYVRSVTLFNPFKPDDPTDSFGVGYYAYGYANLATSVITQATSLKVTVSPSSTRHIAVNADAVFVAFSG